MKIIITKLVPTACLACKSKMRIRIGTTMMPPPTPNKPPRKPEKTPRRASKIEVMKFKLAVPTQIRDVTEVI